MKEITSSLVLKCFKPSSKLDIPQNNLFSFLHDEHTDLLFFFEKELIVF
jgi:hypothetical protein